LPSGLDSYTINLLNSSVTQKLFYRVEIMATEMGECNFFKLVISNIIQLLCTRYFNQSHAVEFSFAIVPKAKHTSSFGVPILFTPVRSFSTFSIIVLNIYINESLLIFLVIPVIHFGINSYKRNSRNFMVTYFRFLKEVFRPGIGLRLAGPLLPNNIAFLAKR
jgi:hypothetical protein